MIIVYCLVTLIATTIGALSGLGGGVIIKPVFDFIGFHDVSMINFLSAVAVFAMALSSTYQQVRAKTKIDTKFVLFIATGSILGGLIGGKCFDVLLLQLGEATAKGLQSLILGLFIGGVIIYLNGNYRSYQFKHPMIVFLIGLLLGSVASFLGVGGGPINVAFITFFFSMDLKATAVYSIAVILFSQGTKLFSIYHATAFLPFDLRYLWFIVPTAILGGVLGAKFNRFFTETKIKRIFISTAYFLLFINFFNAYQAFFR